MLKAASASAPVVCVVTLAAASFPCGYSDKLFFYVETCNLNKLDF